MIAVIFEVEPAKGQRDSYFDLATKLKNDLTKMDGFISIERFQSLTNENKVLSLSFWRDEEAVKGWRNHSLHRQTQGLGREGVFSNYRLRVAVVERDYGLNRRDDAPLDSRSYFPDDA